MLLCSSGVILKIKLCMIPILTAMQNYFLINLLNQGDWEKIWLRGSRQECLIMEKFCQGDGRILTWDNVAEWPVAGTSHHE